MASDRFSTEDFVRALPLMEATGAAGASYLHLAGTSGESATREVVLHGDAIPDEDVAIRQLMLKIIKTGLESVHGSSEPARVIVIGAGCAGLVTARELKRCGFDVVILEASHRLGGRVKTIREPFAHGLHGEGGAMRLPESHALVHAYLKKLGLDDDLESFPQHNPLIYLSGYGKPLAYNTFEQLLISKDPKLSALFAKLAKEEQGKTSDTLWNLAVAPVNKLWHTTYVAAIADGIGIAEATEAAYEAVEDKYGRYSLQGFLESEAHWTADAVLLYDLANAHVILANAFTETWKEGFYSSQAAGAVAGMRQLTNGMEALPLALANPPDKIDLSKNVRYGATVRRVQRMALEGPNRLRVTYDTTYGRARTIKGDYIVFALPFPALNLLEIDPRFSTAKRTAIRTLHYVEVTKILLQFKTRWWERYLAKRSPVRDGGVITDLPIRYVMFPSSDAAQFDGEQKRGVVLASYVSEQDATGLGALSEDVRLRIAARDMGTIFGERLINDQLEVGVSQVWGATAATGGSAFAFYGPGQRKALFEGMTEPDWDGTALFAGEHASYSHGWVEGAIESGLRAAYQVYKHQLPNAIVK